MKEKGVICIQEKGSVPDLELYVVDDFRIRIDIGFAVSLSFANENINRSSYLKLIEKEK